MGYVAIYASYVEEYLGECFHMLEAFDPRRGGQLWQASLRIESCRRAIRALPRHDTLAEVDVGLGNAKRLLRSRNYALHSPLYGLPGSGNIRRAVQANAPQQFTTAEEIYDLAEALFASANDLIAASVRLPRAIHEARNV
jgi:hypothetical protein